MKIAEDYIVEKVVEFLVNKKDGNWHLEKSKKSKLHGNGADIIMVGGSKNGERFIIECKGNSDAKSANSINKEGWLNALGQLITRMNVNRFVKSKDSNNFYTINRAYKYGIGLYWKGAKVALRRIPKAIAQTLNLYIFALNDNGEIKQFTPSQFGKELSDKAFNK